MKPSPMVGIPTIVAFLFCFNVYETNSHEPATKGDVTIYKGISLFSGLAMLVERMGEVLP